MKTILLFSALLFSFSSFSSEVDVIHAEFGVVDEAGNPELCMTVVRIPESGAVIGIVETMYDCFYTRQAKKNARIDINLNSLQRPETSLLEHLQNQGGPLEFLISEGE